MHAPTHPGPKGAAPPAPPSFRRLRSRIWLALACPLLASLTLPASAQTSSGYQQTNIVSDGSVTAQKTDPTLLNPWGISVDTQDFWTNAAGSGIDIVGDSAGNKAFTVTIPPASSKEPHGLPSGTVFNPDSTEFPLPGTINAVFLFCSLDGQVSGWNANTPTAIVAIDNSSKSAVYTGMALDKNGTGSFLLLANFGKDNRVEVYDKSFQPATLAGSFTDPNLPSGYSPFGIHVIGNSVYVTYAQHDPTTGREAVGAGLGIVDAFDLNGNFVKQAIVQADLNAPWGMALAPAGFGAFGNDLLVGNFGDGVINVYDPATFAHLGQLQDANGKALANLSLWEILFVPSNLGDPNTLYFAAGLDQEQHGLFGSIAPIQAPVSGNFTLASTQTALTLSAGQTATTAISVTPANGFTGTVNFACTGLPTGASCSFSPATVTVATGAASTMLTVSTAGAATGNPYQIGSIEDHARTWPFALALLLPMAFFGSRKTLRKIDTRWVALIIVLGGALGGVTLLSGCGGNKTQTPMPTGTTTPPGASQLTVTATAGSLTQTTVIALTVK